MSEKFYNIPISEGFFTNIIDERIEGETFEQTLIRLIYSNNEIVGIIGPDDNDPPKPRHYFRRFILNALHDHNGKMTAKDCIKTIEKSITLELNSADWSRRNSGEIVWKNNVNWERQAMVNDGIILSSSQGAKRGVWELTEKGRNLAS